MKYILTCYFLCCCLGAYPQRILTGKVYDKKTGESLVGVAVYFPDLKSGTATDVNGAYKFANLPRGKHLVQVKLIGYAAGTEVLDLDTLTVKDFYLETSVREINEVVVTGLSQASERKRIPGSVTGISQAALMQSSSTNIIAALAKQPGISQVSTGPGISKPVIRGLGYNRVLVVNDGIRQEGQQWGDEHGIEIDEYSVSRVEVLKGPASLTYGSDAMAGVINMISSPTVQEGKIEGHFISNYQSNQGLTGNSLNLAGNQKGLIWDARYTRKTAHAYHNRYDGYVYGSAMGEESYGALIGLNKSWGYSHLQVGSYHLSTGIVEGERDSTSGNFTRKVAVNDTLAGESIVTGKELLSYEPGVPRQDILHTKAVWNNNFILGKGQLKIIAGLQRNERKEFGNVFDPRAYGLFFRLTTFTYDGRYVLPEYKKIQSSLGINGMRQVSQNLGTEFLVPAYDLFDLGIFLTARRNFGKLDLSGGARYDQRAQSGKSLFTDYAGAAAAGPGVGIYQRFQGFNKNFNGYSGSIGATYQFSEKCFSKLNVSKGFRMPNIAELGANGEHEGTGRYERGNVNLRPENNFQADAAFGVDIEHLSVELDLFRNDINGFIYLSKLNSASGGDSVMNALDPLPVFAFTQGNAYLQGGELKVDVHPHPLDWLHVENALSYVQGVQKNASDSARYLPFIPAAKVTSEIRADLQKTGRVFKNVYLRLEAENYFAQKNIYAAFGTEEPTAAYTLLNAGIGGSIARKGKERFTLVVNVDNITDAAYQDHLSRLKYAPLNYATGRKGVYNMGRNFSFKLIIPIDVI